MQFSSGGGTARRRAELVFPFNPRMARPRSSARRLGGRRQPEAAGRDQAPDFGQMLLSGAPRGASQGVAAGQPGKPYGGLHAGGRPAPRPGETVALAMEPCAAAPPELKDQSMWSAARRGWFRTPSSLTRRGAIRATRIPQAGILANNVISDPVSCLIHLWADQALLDAPVLFRHPPERHGAADRGLVADHRTRPSGEIVAYWNYGDMLDANASPLIAAWDYVEATGDRAWLARRIGRLEFIADYMVRRDVDVDGLVESTHSGNYGTLKDPDADGLGLRRDQRRPQGTPTATP